MAFLAPLINEQQEDVNGKPLAGGKIWVYLAGTSTPATTYSDKAGLVPNTNPIVLNSLGVNMQGAVWLTGGSAYKFVITDSLGTLQRTIDDVSGVNDTTVTADQWIVYQADPTYVSATSFTVPGDQTQIFQPGRRIKSQNTGGLVYSTIATSAYSAPNTTVTVVNTSGVLDAGLSQVSYGLISVQDSSITGLLLRTSIYYRVAGVQKVSVDGGAPTDTGAGTFTALSGTTFAEVEATGAGGGSGGNPTTTALQQVFTAGGGGGSFGVGRYPTPLSGIVVTVGAAGAAGGLNAAGGTGGSTSFGALLVSPGGSGSPPGIAADGVWSAGGVAGGALPTGANMIAVNGGTSAQVLAAAVGYVSGQTGGLSGSGAPNGYGTGAGGKYNGPGTASPQAGFAASFSGLLVVREYA